MIRTLLVLLATTACGLDYGEDPAEVVPEEQPEEVVNPRVEQAATIANAIAAGTAPEEAMSAEGLDAEGFRDLLFEVAGDPAMTDAYLGLRN